MKNKWLDYFKIISPIYLVAYVFDQHYKLDGLHEYLSTYYEILKFYVYAIFIEVKKIMLYMKNIVEFIVHVLISPSLPN